ncbi:MAG: TonB-dependent receptor [Bacteroidetes bacterium]|nr:TonB-dependent receptor [Bacteroidota bacterium]
MERDRNSGKGKTGTMTGRFAGILILLASAHVSRVQENTVLPDLAPRIVEITGELTISFPSLRRQPLVGFNPPPHVPDIASSRRPFTEAYKQPSADLPPSQLQHPEPPPVSSVADRTPVQGIIEAGLGRYFDRYVTTDLSADIGPRTLLLVRGAYNGTSGYSPFTTDPTIETSSNREFVDVGMRVGMTSAIIGIDVGASRSDYSLYGAVPAPGALSQKNPSRIVSDIHSELWLESQPSNSIRGRLAIGVGRTEVKTDVFDPLVRIDPSTERTAKRMTFDGSLKFPFSGGLIHVDAQGSLQGLDESGFPGNTITSGSASVTYRFDPTDRFRASIGVRALGFDAVGQTPLGGDRLLVYVSPVILVEYSIRPGIELFLGDQPVLKDISMAELYRLGPYLADEPAIQPVLMPTHLMTGIRVSGDRIHASIQAGWKDVKNYRYAENSSSTVRGYTTGYPVLGYEDATVLYAKAHLTAIPTTGIQASIRVAYRNGRLDDSESVIPYFSPFTYGASFSVGIMDGLLLVQLTAQGESSRYIDRAETSKTGSVLRLGAEASYFLTEQAGITVGVRNLGSKREFWDNYTPEGSVFYTGVRWRW